MPGEEMSYGKSPSGLRFADGATEERYRAFFLEHDKRQALIAIGLYTTLKAAFGVIDVMVQSGDQTGDVLIARYAFVFVSLVALALLLRVRAPVQYDSLVFSWTLLAVASAFYTITHRPADHFGFVSTSPMLIVLFFAFFRNRFELQLSVSALLVATDMFTVFLLREPRPLPALVQICAAYAIAILVGITVSRQLKLSRRGYYAMLQREHELAEGMRELAYRDELTGVLNRRSFLLQAGAIWLRHQADRSGCLLILDLDHFKRLNDTWGHDAGDAALRRFAELVQSTKREQDVFGRIGGEEFALLLPRTSREDAEQVADRIATECKELLPGGAAGDRLSVSIGIARIGASDQDLAATMRRADRALYRAKATGRGRTCMAEEDLLIA